MASGDLNLRGLSPIDLAVMVAYVVAIIFWGLRNSSRKSAEGYFLGGRTMSWPVVGLSMFATVVSSSSLVGWAGDAYSTGIAVFNYGISAAIIPIVFFLVFFLPFYLGNRIYTLPEYLERRFDSRSRTYLSSMTVIGYVFADLPITLYSGALMLRLVFPSANQTYLIWALAILGGSYTLVGGLSAVMRVELVQAFILITGSAILSFCAFSKAGGWNAVMTAAPEGHLSLLRSANDSSVPWPALIISLPLGGFYFWGLSQTMVQRTLSARSIDQGRWGNLLAGALNFLIFFLMVLPGIAGRVLYPGLAKPDLIYPTLVFHLLPPGVLGLVLIGFIAAMTSVLTSTLNSAQTLVTIDLVRKLFPRVTSQQQVTIGSAAGIVMMAAAALWAPQIARFDSIVKYFQQILAYIAPPVVAVFVLGLFWKRTTASGAFAGLLAGFGLAVIVLVLRSTTNLSEFNFLYITPLLTALCSAVIVIVSLSTDAPDVSVVERYVWNSQIYKAESQSLASKPYYLNYRVLSIALLIVTGIFFIIWR